MVQDDLKHVKDGGCHGPYVIYKLSTAGFSYLPKGQKTSKDTRSL